MVSTSFSSGAESCVLTADSFLTKEVTIVRSTLKSFISLLVSVGISLGLLCTAALAQSGSLEPPASAVDAFGDPVPTTQPQPSWDQVLPANDGDATTGCNSTRFKCVMPTPANPGGEAVLDKETGLVWEQSPDTITHTWRSARFPCKNGTTGGRRGWRLPSVHELASLVDPNNPTGNPDLPPGHPFSNVQASNYWSATTDPDYPTFAWYVGFSNGSASPSLEVITGFVWCVRGGMNVEVY